MKVVWVLISAVLAQAAGHEVAITIDDLPRGGDHGGRSAAAIREMTQRLLQPFREEKIPVIGFVNEGRGELGPKELRGILDLWLDAGADLGNHTYSHPDLNAMPLKKFEDDVMRGEIVTRAALAGRGKKLEFFRHPFLHAGATAETKRGLEEFLASRGYRVAPVTFDNSDYMFAALRSDRATRAFVPYLESVIEFFEERSIEVVGSEFPQILLLHASDMNAELMPEILAMFKRRGYSFVSLRHALEDEVYRQPESYVGKGGFSWIHRWSMTKKMANKGEPDEPEWVRNAFSSLGR